MKFKGRFRRLKSPITCRFYKQTAPLLVTPSGMPLPAPGWCLGLLPCVPPRLIAVLWHWWASYTHCALAGQWLVLLKAELLFGACWKSHTNWRVCCVAGEPCWCRISFNDVLSCFTNSYLCVLHHPVLHMHLHHLSDLTCGVTLICETIEMQTQ